MEMNLTNNNNFNPMDLTDPKQEKSLKDYHQLEIDPKV
jgi:hypothetical protein